MTFAQIPAGAAIFLDANTLVYHFANHPNFGAACTQLVKRIEQHELPGFISTHVLSEIAHRLMTLEAARPVWLAACRDRGSASQASLRDPQVERRMSRPSRESRSWESRSLQSLHFLSRPRLWSASSTNCSWVTP